MIADLAEPVLLLDETSGTDRPSAEPSLIGLTAA